MELEEEFSRNRTEMKRIKKQADTAVVFYALYLAFALFEVYFAIMMSQKLFYLSALLVIATSVIGFLGIYHKDNRFSIASLVLIACHSVAFAFYGGFDILGLFISLIGHGGIIWYIILNIRNNNRYHWLEQQDGFPNFEVKQALYDMDKRQRAIKDPYAIKKEEIEKRTGATGEMEEL